jgi:predicted DsbA family dithiol-disulfide isomerase
VTDGIVVRPSLHVDIWSDVVCPWCYIGLRRFESAREQLVDDIEVSWSFHPYQLDPHAPTKPTPVSEAYASKFGGPDAAAQIMAHVTSVAAGEGIEFRMDLAMRANTFDAHRLLWLTSATGHQHAVKERLLRAYFCDGDNIADQATLVRCAGDVGLDPNRVAAFLASTDGAAQVRDELAHAASAGITAVPTFVVNGAWAIPGAQDPSTFVQVLRRMASRTEDQ